MLKKQRLRKSEVKCSRSQPQQMQESGLHQASGLPRCSLEAWRQALATWGGLVENQHGLRGRQAWIQVLSHPLNRFVTLSYLISLSLNFLISRMGIITSIHSVAMKRKWDNTCKSPTTVSTHSSCLINVSQHPFSGVKDAFQKQYYLLCHRCLSARHGASMFYRGRNSSWPL